MAARLAARTRAPGRFRVPEGAPRPAIYALAALGALSLLLSTPAYADGAANGSGVPDGGAAPIAGAPLVLPPNATSAGTPQASQPATVGPLAQQITQMETDVEGKGERLKQKNADLTQAQHAADATRQGWQAAEANVDNLRSKLDTAAGAAYKAAVALGPYGNLANDVHQLSELAPGFGGTVSGPDGTETTARELARAQQQAQAKQQAYRTATTVLTNLTKDRDSMQATYDQAAAGLTDLRSRNSDQLLAAQTEQDRFEQSLASRFNPGSSVNGMAANPLAIKAVQFALAQLGKPYVWGTEGPDTYDCSGLVWAAYQSVGLDLPRIANTQHQATTPVPVSDLLPGDLLFFSTSPTDWTQIHHVGIYVGDGEMVHAPTTGEVVKRSPVWWSEFFGATRVIPAVPAASPPPSSKPTPSTPAASPPPSRLAPPHPAPQPNPPSSEPPSSEPPSSEPPSSEPPSSAPAAGTSSASASASSGTPSSGTSSAGASGGGGASSSTNPGAGGTP